MVLLGLLGLPGPFWAEDRGAPAAPPVPPAVPGAPATPSGTLSDPGPADPLDWLGLTPERAYERLGPPEEVLPVKIAEDQWQVVHFHSDFVYLFWYQNRVWQVRLDKRHAGPFLGVRMGTERKAVQTVLGKALGSGENWEVYQLPYKGFVRRARLVYENDLLSDAYLYRSDF